MNAIVSAASVVAAGLAVGLAAILENQKLFQNKKNFKR